MNDIPASFWLLLVFTHFAAFFMGYSLWAMMRVAKLADREMEHETTEG